MHEKIITIDRYIAEQEHEYPEATGAFSSILYNLVLAAKVTWREVSKAGLVNIVGSADQTNIQGEEQQKLDVFANNAIIKFCQQSREVCVMASEEEDTIIDLSANFPDAKYVLLFDPLDGSSNIDVNAPIGTIFSIYRRVGASELTEECLQPGIKQVAAGYIIFGSSTMLVYTTGRGTHGFTLDPSIGEFLLSHPDIRIPEKGTIYSCNEGNFSKWNESVKQYVQWVKESDAGTKRPYKARYIGSLIADVHRTLLKGGIFAYPAEIKTPKGKLRLCYEANPMAFVVEQAGGMGVNEQGQRILEQKPSELHERTSLYLGSVQNIEELAGFLKA
ncbi:MAG: class 1 fructose-bisphosphatase [bacterium]